LSRRTKTGGAGTVDTRTLQRLAELSRLSIGPEEIGSLKEDLSSILGYFAALDSVDVSKSSAYQPMKGAAQRKDVVRASMPEELLRGVPQRKGRYVKAPRVF
jgi:aspartyl/glutamyl-tRNA(Asn/Gln) amidotransferase C subunit